MRHATRGGRFFRVCDPSWHDPLDTSYSKDHGGRWNPRGEFGALYVCASVLVAAANARRVYENEIATLHDLLPEERPDLQIVNVKETPFVDAVTADGLRALGLPASFPSGIGWIRCQRIARAAHEARESGVVYRSAAERSADAEEELAIFDSSLQLVRRRRRVSFTEWYPLERANEP